MQKPGFLMMRLIYIYELYHVVVVVLGFYVPPTAKVIQRQDLGLKSYPKDWRSPGTNSRPLVYKASSLTTTPRRFLSCIMRKPASTHTYVENKGATRSAVHDERLCDSLLFYQFCNLNSIPRKHAFSKGKNKKRRSAAW